MRLRRTKLQNGVGPSSGANHTWGGHSMLDPDSGEWVGFFSYMAGGCDLGTWQSNSMIVSAVADAPDGPYDQKVQPVTGPWSHNAMISRHPNGTYFLFHIGDGTTKRGIANCSSRPDPFYPFHEPPSCNTHASDRLEGPWRPAPGIPAINNPAPFFFDNGTTLIYGRTDVHWAPSIDGPWDPSHKRTTVPVSGKMVPEDPFVWREPRGFHMLFNANSGHSNCAAKTPCGGHAWSRDGLAWSVPTIPAFGTIVHYEDNSTRVYDYVERPQIVQDTNGRPLTLFVGHGYSDIHTLAIMFCQEGDDDCVTMIQS
eukprot:TRINITY_DN4095_c0_g1_i1.p1 TRINITY_DN4095_c0_g1~~TRINITY_DN4095_c0_g1_i1.p1  ORF type:complete len:311 (+),score=24.15 TRINITY_DN4095_c0_g1_i1:366-1298(+)